MKSRGWWILTAAALAFASFFVVRLTQAISSKSGTAAASAAPTVTVTTAGTTNVPTLVTIIGTIAARNDIPVGVEGDGGRVAEINVEAGDHVKRGQMLARLSVAVLQPQVGSLQAALEQTRAEAELAGAEYQRALRVGASGALSAEETERRRSTSVTAAAKVKVAAAQLAESQARLERAQIRAPADGTILTRGIEVGQTANPGGPPLFRLASGNEIELRGEVAEQDLPLLEVGQPAAVRLTGIPQSYPGKVRLLGAVIDPATRLGMVRIALAPDSKLRPGAFARAEVTVSKASRAVLPQTAVLTDDKGSYVLIVDSADKIARREVHVSGIVAEGVTISAGLDPQDRIVATAGAFLQVGETVRPVQAVPGAS